MTRVRVVISDSAGVCIHQETHSTRKIGMEAEKEAESIVWAKYRTTMEKVGRPVKFSNVTIKLRTLEK